MSEAVTLEEALAFVRQLSPVDKARLIEHMALDIERELRATRSTPHMSLRGLWQALDITEEETDQARQEILDRPFAEMAQTLYDYSAEPKEIRAFMVFDLPTAHPAICRPGRLPGGH